MASGDPKWKKKRFSMVMGPNAQPLPPADNQNTEPVTRETLEAARQQAIREDSERRKPIDPQVVVQWIKDAGIRLQGARVAVLRDIAKSVTSSGLLLPDTAIKGKQLTGTVVMVGEALQNQWAADSDDDVAWGGPPIEPGDRCTFTKYGEVEASLTFEDDSGEEIVVNFDIFGLSDIYFNWKEHPHGSDAGGSANPDPGSDINVGSCPGGGFTGISGGTAGSPLDERPLAEDMILGEDRE